jgi:hypothetical protein
MSDDKNLDIRKHGFHAVEEDFGIKILKTGTWLHQGRPIKRLPLVKLFATVLKIDEKGDYWLQTPVERGRIEVEDKPFVAVEMQVESSEKGQNLLFRTNLDDWVTVDAAHPLLFDDTPYVMVRDGLAARLNRATYYALMEMAAPAAGDAKTYGVWSGGMFFPVARIAADAKIKEQE